MFQHGIVCGKFYPLHAGHHYLISKAIEQCRKVTIFVVFTAGEDPDGDRRFGWVKKAYPTANVRKVCNLCADDTSPESNVDWATYTRHILENDMPDAVFSSEQYAIGWAKEMGATHVLVDGPRSSFAVSGTQIRKDPYLFWNLIHPVARPFYTKKVLIVGAESTGKTKMCIHLSRKYNTFFVPEYARVFVEKHGITEAVKRAIFPEIVNEQQRMEDGMFEVANKVLFCDTDLITTWFWYQRWQPDNAGDILGQTILEEAYSRVDSYDLVLISDDVGTRWIDDGFRDQKDTRKWFTESFKQKYKELRLPTILLSGSWEQREEKAIRSVNALFGSTEAVLPLKG